MQGRLGLRKKGATMSETWLSLVVLKDPFTPLPSPGVTTVVSPKIFLGGPRLCLTTPSQTPISWPLSGGYQYQYRHVSGPRGPPSRPSVPHTPRHDPNTCRAARRPRSGRGTSLRLPTSTCRRQCLCDVPLPVRLTPTPSSGPGVADTPALHPAQPLGGTGTGVEVRGQDRACLSRSDTTGKSSEGRVVP